MRLMLLVLLAAAPLLAQTDWQSLHRDDYTWGKFDPEASGVVSARFTEAPPANPGKDLVAVRLEGVGIGDEGLGKAPAKWKVLQVLKGGITDAGFAALCKEADSLEELVLIDVANLSGKGLESLASLKKLRSLTLSKTDTFGNEQLAALPQLAGVQAIELWGFDAGPAMDALAKMPNARVVRLFSNAVGDPSLQDRFRELLTTRTIEELGINTPLPAQAFMGLAMVPALKRLVFNGSNLDDASIDALVNLRRVESIHIHNQALSLSNARKLAGMAGLHTLRLSGITGMKTYPFEALSKNKNLRVLELGSNEADDAEEVELLAANTALKEFRIKLAAPTEKQLAFLAKLADLEVLEWEFNAAAPDDLLFKAAAKLKKLRLLSTNATGSLKAINALTCVKTLEYLKVAFVAAEADEAPRTIRKKFKKVLFA